MSEGPVEAEAVSEGKGVCCVPLRQLMLGRCSFRQAPCPRRPLPLAGSWAGVAAEPVEKSNQEARRL